MNIFCHSCRTGFDEKGSDGPYLSKQQKCTGRRDEKDIVERFFPWKISYFSLAFVCIHCSSLPLVEYNQAFCRRKMLVQQFEKMQVTMDKSNHLVSTLSPSSSARTAPWCRCTGRRTWCRTWPLYAGGRSCRWWCRYSGQWHSQGTDPVMWHR